MVDQDTPDSPNRYTISIDEVRGKSRLTNWLLAGILIALLGILAMDYTRSVDESASGKETLCLEEGGTVTQDQRGGLVCDMFPAASPGEKFGPEDWSIDLLGVDRFTEKEIFCLRTQGGRIEWNTRGNKICDIAPYADEQGGTFDLDEDWLIE